MKDLYQKTFKKDNLKVEPETKIIKKFEESFADFSNRLSKLEDKVTERAVVQLTTPDVQKVQVTNPQEAIEIQKVEITNPQEQKDVIFPEVQKVELTNQEKPKDIVFPDVQKVEITNPQKFPDIKFPPIEKVNLPVGNGDNPKKGADPSRYVVVRLSNGKRFYSALEDAYVAAAKQSFPFVNQTTGNPQAATVDNAGNLNVNASAQLTSTSGQPIFSYQTNIPTIQSVFVTNPSAATVSTTSGTPLDVTIRNIPTVQTVVVQSMPNLSVTTASGQPGLNFPTVQTVNVQNMPATVSGTNHTFLDNIPTIQTIYGQVVGDVASQQVDNSNPVKVGGSRRATFPTYVDGTRSGLHVDENGGLLIRPIQPLTISGSPTVTISGIPTIQTVRDNSVTISGSQHTVIDNFPNTQMVTSVSGSVHSVIDNFPTVLTINNPTAGNSMNVSYDTTDTVYSGVVSNLVLHAPLIASSAGVTTLISGVANKVIKVLDFGFMSNGVVNVDFRSVNSQKQLTGLFYEIANTGYSSGYNPKGHFHSEVGEGLAIELSASIAVGGYLTYILSQ